MIKKVTITNYRYEQKTIILSDPWDAGFAIIDIDGLGPVSANINMTEITSMDGARFNSARVPARNITMTFALGYYPTIEHARQELYRIFPIKKQVTIDIETDIRVYRTTGYVESVTPSIFSSQENVTVSILCPQPYFQAANESEEFSGSISQSQSFEFPFSNESLTDPLIEFAGALSSVSFEVLYTGSVETGLSFYIRAESVSDPATVFTITKEDTGDEMIIQTENLPGGSLLDGDQIIIITVPGNKGVYLIRNDEVLNAINALTMESTWLSVYPGSNIFSISTSSSGAGSFDIWFEYSPLYEGV